MLSLGGGGGGGGLADMCGCKTIIHMLMCRARSQKVGAEPPHLQKWGGLSLTPNLH